MEQSLFQMIQLMGFPAVMCLWFMLRTEKAIMNNTTALQELKEEIKRKK